MKELADLAGTETSVLYDKFRSEIQGNNNVTDPTDIRVLTAITLRQRAVKAMALGEAKLVSSPKQETLRRCRS